MSDLIPASRAEALATGAPRYFTGKSCKHGHVSERFAYGVCVACDEVHNKHYWRTVKDTPKEKERCRTKAAKAREENAEKLNERTREWRIKNPAWNKEYRRANLARYAAHAAKRRAAEQAPSWTPLICVNALYGIRDRLRRSGLDVHVDHVIPLQGKKVSGLHVRENLRIIPATENFQKNNKFLVA